MRFAPKSLAGQLTLLLLALAAAQGIAVALFAWERMEALRHAHRDDAVMRTATVARLLAGTPPGLHDAVIAAASTELARFSLTGEPVVGEPGAGERAATIAGDLSAALGIAPERVRVGHRQLPARRSLYHRLLDGRAEQVPDEPDDRSHAQLGENAVKVGRALRERRGLPAVA